MDEELREATPRPWIVADETVTEHGAEVAIIEAGVSIARPLDESLIEPGDPLADAALIVEAVNDYDRLRRIEKAARGPVLGAFDVLAKLREVARQAGNADLIAALEPARHAEAALRTALGED
jgi:hypothetical protein